MGAENSSELVQIGSNGVTLAEKCYDHCFLRQLDLNVKRAYYHCPPIFVSAQGGDQTQPVTRQAIVMQEKGSFIRVGNVHVKPFEQRKPSRVWIFQNPLFIKTPKLYRTLLRKAITFTVVIADSGKNCYFNKTPRHQNHKPKSSGQSFSQNFCHNFFA